MLTYEKVSAKRAKSSLRCAKKYDGSQDARTRLSILSLLVLIKQWLICLFILLNVDGLPWEYGYMALWALCAISGVTG